MYLTKEDFEQIAIVVDERVEKTVEKVVERVVDKHLTQRLEPIIANMATKKDLESGLAGLEKRLIIQINESQEELARIVASGFDDLQHRLDVREKVEKHEVLINQITSKIGLTT